MGGSGQKQLLSFTKKQITASLSKVSLSVTRIGVKCEQKCCDCFKMEERLSCTKKDRGNMTRAIASKHIIDQLSKGLVPSAKSRVPNHKNGSAEFPPDFRGDGA